MTNDAATATRMSWTIAAMTAGVFVLDCFVPSGFAGGVPYVLTVAFSLWLPRTRSTYTSAAIVAALTVIGSFMSPMGVGLRTVLANRFLALLAIWVTALLVVLRKEQDVRLRQSETLQRVILNASQDPMITIDSLGIVRFASDSVERVFGWKREEIIGQNISILLPEPHNSQRDGHLKRYRRTGKSDLLDGRRELQALRKDASVFPCEASLSRVDLPDSGALFVGHLQDITERKALESQLAQAHKLESIGQLAAGIAHEINTPTQYVGDNTRFLQEAFADLATVLTTCRGLAGALPGEPVSPDLVNEVREAMERADLDYLTEEIPRAIQQSLDGIERVAKIVHAMKEFSHPAEDKTLNDLNRAIETTITVARNEWKYVAEVVTDFDSDLPLVPCLPGDFNQAILNLIVNAAHAICDAVGDGAQRKGTITVSTQLVGDWAEIRITDTGTGIPEDIKDKIFDPFFTTKEVGKGTGQGLSMAHTFVVQKQGGTISVDTEVGKGTSFIIRLPVADPATVTEEAWAPAPARLSV